MKLNVGCGGDKRGDARLDVTRNPSYHHRSGLPPTVNIIADAEHLPFKDDSFEELRIHEVLEHLLDWRKAISECVRVAEKISITVPIESYLPRHYLTSIYAPTLNNFRLIMALPERTREHLWQFNVVVLKGFLESKGVNVEKITETYSPIVDYFKFLKGLSFFKRSWRVIGSRAKTSD